MFYIVRIVGFCRSATKKTVVKLCSIEEARGCTVLFFLWDGFASQKKLCLLRKLREAQIGFEFVRQVKVLIPTYITLIAKLQLF